MQKKGILLIASLLFLTMGCRDLVQDEFGSFEKTPVVNAVFKDGEEIVVRLSYTGSVGDTLLAIIDNAEISIYENGVFVETMQINNPMSENDYCSTVVAKAGNTYLCEVAIPGYDIITCSETIPNPVTIKSWKFIRRAGLDEEGTPYSSATFSFDNDLSVDQYFQVVFKGSNSYGTRDITDPLLDLADPIIKGEGIPIPIFSDINMKSDNYEMTLNFYSENYSDITMELRSLSKDLYKYLRSSYLYEMSRYPYDILSVVPGYNLYSNVDGCYGIFAGYSSFEVNLTNSVGP